MTVKMPPRGVVLAFNRALAEQPMLQGDDGQPVDELSKAVKHPGPGWQPIPQGKKGGFRKRDGDKWEYWYPEPKGKPDVPDEIARFPHLAKEWKAALKQGLSVSLDEGSVEMYEILAEGKLPKGHTKDKVARAHVKLDVKIPEPENVRAVRLVQPRSKRGHYAILHIGVKPENRGRWQLSWFDEEGPIGDTSRATVQEAFDVAHSEGYRTVEIVRKPPAQQMGLFDEEPDTSTDWKPKPKAKRRDEELIDLYGEKSAPQPGEKGYKPPLQRPEGALDGFTAPEVAEQMWASANSLIEDPDLAQLLDPEWVAEWSGEIYEGGYYDQEEIEDNKWFLSGLMHVPKRGLDGKEAPVDARSDFAHDVLHMAAQVRGGTNPAMLDYQTHIDGERYLPRGGGQLPDWAAEAIIAERLTPEPGKLKLVNVTKDEAAQFIEKHHSALPYLNPRGLMYALGLKQGERLVAVATAG